MPFDLDSAFAKVDIAVRDGRIPGAVLGVVTREGKREIVCTGAAQLTPVVLPMKPDTQFDLASLTKVLFTAQHWLRLFEAGQYQPETAISKLIPDLRQYDLDAWERRLTLAQLLAHATPLPAVKPIYTLGLTPGTLRAYVLQREWKRLPQPVYSDVNYWLLGIALERHYGRQLHELAPEVAGLTFKPQVERCAATEYCHWRQRMLRGEVHDENAYAFGGAAGHAGLFGDAAAVLDFAQALLQGKRLQPSTLAWVEQPFRPQRSLGWELRYVGWSGAERCSPRTIGHTGFTGVGLWIDLEQGLAWTLLTNRVHPTRHHESGIQPLRRAVSEALYGASAGSSAG